MSQWHKASSANYFANVGQLLDYMTQPINKYIICFCAIDERLLGEVIDVLVDFLGVLFTHQIHS